MPTIRFERAVHESPFHGGVRHALMRILITGIAVFLAIAISRELSNASIRIDDFGRTARFVLKIWEGAAVDGPAIEDGRNQADDQRATDGGPES